MTRHFLEVDDLDPVRLARILDHAIVWKADASAVPPVLAGGAVAAMFEKPSARTRISIEVAIATLGGHPIYVRGEEVGLDVRESVEDVARTMSGMCVGDRGPGVRPHDPRTDARRRRRSDREPPVGSSRIRARRWPTC